MANVDLVIDTDAGTGKLLVHVNGVAPVVPGGGGPPRVSPKAVGGATVGWTNNISSKNEVTLVFPEWANEAFNPAPRVQKIAFGTTAYRTRKSTTPPGLKKKQTYMGYDSVTMQLIEGGSDPDLDIK